MNDASKRGVPFDRAVFTVTFLRGLLSTQRHCDCCGVELDISHKDDRKFRNASPSIDRFVPRLGYVLGNVSLICWRCNNLKRDATADELETVVVWMRRRERMA